MVTYSSYILFLRELLLFFRLPDKNTYRKNVVFNNLKLAGKFLVIIVFKRKHVHIPREIEVENQTIPVLRAGI